MRRNIAGANAMGFGGMLDGGCAVGAGLSGAYVFTLTSWFTPLAIWGAAALTARVMDQHEPVPIGQAIDQPMPGAALP